MSLAISDPSLGSSFIDPFTARRLHLLTEQTGSSGKPGGLYSEGEVVDRATDYFVQGFSWLSSVSSGKFAIVALIMPRILPSNLL
jgi:hypothetical protein